MEKFNKKITKKTIDKIINFILIKEDIEDILLSSTDKLNELTIKFIQELKLESFYDKESISELILFLNIFNICYFKNNPTEIENFLFAIFHIEKKNTKIEEFKLRLKIFNLNFKKELMSNFELNINYYFIEYPIGKSEIIYNENEIDLEEEEKDQEKTLLINSLFKIFDLFIVLAFKNKYLNKTSTQFIKYFMTFITMKNKNIYIHNNNSILSEIEIKLNENEISKFFHKYNFLFLSFLFLNPYLDYSFSLIDFISDFIIKINNNKLELLAKANNIFSNFIYEEKENIFSEFLLDFCKKENIFLVLDIKNFSEIKHLNLSENYYESINQRDICLFHFINCFKLSYSQYLNKFYSNNQENHHLFDKLKTFEIFQEIHDSIFFIPKMFKYCKLYLSDNIKLNSQNLIKIEYDMVNRISKSSRLDTRFSYNLINFDAEKYNNKESNSILSFEKKVFDKKEKVKSFFNLSELNFDLILFVEKLIEYLNNLFDNLITNSYFTLKEKSTSANNEKTSINKANFFNYDEWFLFYINNPYLTFVITQKYFWNFFVEEKFESNRESILDSEKNMDFIYYLISIKNKNKDFNIFNFMDIFDNQILISIIIEKINNNFILAELLK